MALINAIKIDVIKQTVEMIKIENTLDGLRTAAECEYVEHVTFVYLPVGDRGERNILLVDEEGSIKTNGVDGQFMIDSTLGPVRLFGHGLVIGVNDEGDDISTTLGVEDIKKRVHFCQPV